MTRRALSPTNCLFAARALRDFGDSFVAILLPAYLLALGFSPLAVGVLATVSLSGSACLTIGAGVLGARYGYRRLLLAASMLMIVTGLAFAAFDQYAVLLAIAFAGTINPSTGNVSVFVPLEHAALAHAAGDNDRTWMFARYSLAGALAVAVSIPRLCRGILTGVVSDYRHAGQELPAYSVSPIGRWQSPAAG